MDAEEPVYRPLASPAEFEQALNVRRTVFVDEQGGPLADEPDEWDPHARQYGVWWQGRIVGTARLYEEMPGVARIGRVALLPEARGRGWGAGLFQRVLEDCLPERFREVELHAQTHALGFYRRFGFQAVGEEFMEAGVPHYVMRLPLPTPA